MFSMYLGNICFLALDISVNFKDLIAFLSHPVLHVVHGFDVGSHRVSGVTAIPSLRVHKTSPNTAKKCYTEQFFNFYSPFSVYTSMIKLVHPTKSFFTLIFHFGTEFQEEQLKKHSATSPLSSSCSH